MSTTPRRRSQMRKSRALRLLDRLEREPRADAVIDTVRKAVRALPLGDGRDLLHGRWLGHPVHPLMVQVPIGSWLSAAVLDLYPGRSREAGLLVGVGLASAAPAALAGWVDWAELHRQQQRVGLVHALANSTAVGLYAASLTSRVKGRHSTARVYGFLGLTAVALGGMLGGHLAYRQASGANHAEESRMSSPRAGTGSEPWRSSRSTGRCGAAWTTSRSWSSGKPEGRSTPWPSGAATSPGRSPRARSVTDASSARGTAVSSGSGRLERPRPGHRTAAGLRDPDR